MTNYAKKHPYLLTLIIIAIVFITLFAFGYRIQPNFRISKNGLLEMTLPFSNTSVYVDNKKIITTTKENENVIIPLSIKNHTVILGKDSYLPWSKVVAIKPDTSITINPFFITQNQTGQIITQKDPEYWATRYRVSQVKLPTEENPKELSSVKIWVKDNTIYTLRDGEIINIITPVDTIRSIDFYKDRSDVIIFSSDNGVYAVEAEKKAGENKANFFPIYKGVKPIFEKTDNSFLYILDGENLMMVMV
ncbi:MAG: hypothetical protein ACYCZW_00110 [Minisyncoccota bacterium]